MHFGNEIVWGVRESTSQWGVHKKFFMAQPWKGGCPTFLVLYFLWLVLTTQVPQSRSSTLTAQRIYLFSLELFLPPVLTATPSQPTDGGPVTLTCETQLPPQKSNVQLQFCFFRDGQILGSGCSSSLELQIPTMWRKDSGSYWCMAEAMAYRISKNSSRSQIHVQSKCPICCSSRIWAGERRAEC
jgi:hypothetical protein